MFKKKNENKYLEELKSVQLQIDELEKQRKALNCIKNPLFRNNDLLEFIIMVIEGRANANAIYNLAPYCSESEIQELCKNLGDRFYNIAENNRIEKDIFDKLKPLKDREIKLKKCLGIR